MWWTPFWTWHKSRSRTSCLIWAVTMVSFQIGPSQACCACLVIWMVEFALDGIGDGNSEIN